MFLLKKRIIVPISLYFFCVLISFFATKVLIKNFIDKLNYEENMNLKLQQSLFDSTINLQQGTQTAQLKLNHLNLFFNQCGINLFSGLVEMNEGNSHFKSGVKLCLSPLPTFKFKVLGDYSFKDLTISDGTEIMYDFVKSHLSFSSPFINISMLSIKNVNVNIQIDQIDMKAFGFSTNISTDLGQANLNALIKTQDLPLKNLIDRKPPTITQFLQSIIKTNIKLESLTIKDIDKKIVASINGKIAIDQFKDESLRWNDYLNGSLEGNIDQTYFKAAAPPTLNFIYAFAKSANYVGLKEDKILIDLKFKEGSLYLNQLLVR